MKSHKKPTTLSGFAGSPFQFFLIIRSPAPPVYLPYARRKPYSTAADSSLTNTIQVSSRSQPKWQLLSEK